MREHVFGTRIGVFGHRISRERVSEQAQAAAESAVVASNSRAVRKDKASKQVAVLADMRAGWAEHIAKKQSGADSMYPVPPAPDVPFGMMPMGVRYPPGPPPGVGASEHVFRLQQQEERREWLRDNADHKSHVQPPPPAHLMPQPLSQQRGPGGRRRHGEHLGCGVRSPAELNQLRRAKKAVRKSREDMQYATFVEDIAATFTTFGDDARSARKQEQYQCQVAGPPNAARG